MKIGFELEAEIKNTILCILYYITSLMRPVCVNDVFKKKINKIPNAHTLSFLDELDDFYLYV